MPGSVRSYCLCRNPDTGKRYPPGDCPDWNKRGHKLWRFTVDLPPVWDDEKQKHVRQQLHRSGYTSKSDAEDDLVDETGDVKSGTARSLADRRITTGQWLDTWLDSKVNLRPSSRQAYADHIRHYLKPALGRIPVADLRPDHIDHMLARIRSGQLKPEINRRGRDSGGKVSAGTVRVILGVLNNALGAAVKRRTITWNPCAAVELEARDDTETEVWSPQQATRFLAQVDRAAPRFAIAYRLALRLGLRRGEIIALRWGDISLDAHTLTVRRSAVQVGGNVHVGPPKTKKGERTIPLDDDIAAVLRRHHKTQTADRLASTEWDDRGLVVTGERGEPIRPDVLTNQFRALAAQVGGLPPIRLHAARHTAGTIWREAGVDMKIIQEWMGHATLAMTSDLYSHVRPKVSADAAEQVAAYWRSNTSTNTM